MSPASLLLAYVRYPALLPSLLDALWPATQYHGTSESFPRSLTLLPDLNSLFYPSKMRKCTLGTLPGHHAYTLTPGSSLYTFTDEH